MLAVLLSLLSVSSLGATAEQKKLEARAHFKRGAALYKSGDYAECAKEFETSFGLSPHGSILFNVAQCQERAGDAPGAARNYREYLRLTPDAADRSAVETRLRSLQAGTEPVTQTLHIQARPENARIALDGVPRGDAPFTGKVKVGDHRVDVSLEGYRSSGGDVTVLADSPTELLFTLEALAPKASAAVPAAAIVETRAPPSLLQRKRTWTWVALGLAGAATVTGGVFGAQERGLQQQLETQLAPSPQSADATLLGARRDASLANGFYLGAGVALAASVGLFFLEGRP